MQSGRAKTKKWVLDFEPGSARRVEPLMGYTSSADTKQQLRLTFPSKEAAIDYAERNGVPYAIFEPHVSKRRAIAYADNFKYTRIGQWTH